MKKWDYEKHKYEEYNVPESWNCGQYSLDLESSVDCASCGKPIKFAEKYRSLEIYTDKGQEYAVCKSCFKEEWVRRQMRIIEKRSMEIEEVYMEIDDMER